MSAAIGARRVAPRLRAGAVPHPGRSSVRSPRPRPGSTHGGPDRCSRPRSPRPRRASAPTPPRPAPDPTVTATLVNGRARLSAGPFNWDADLPRAHRRREPRPEPDRLPARRARRLRRRVPARHARPAVRRRDRRRHGHRLRAGSDLRGLLAIDGAAPDLADLALDIQVATSSPAEPRRRDARRLARALPDLPRPAQAERDRADDVAGGRRLAAGPVRQVLQQVELRHDARRLLAANRDERPARRR